MYPDAPLIKREGEVNAWDNAEFRDAIRAANKSQILLGGIVTEVCKCDPRLLHYLEYLCAPLTEHTPKGTAFLARSLRAEGYSVWANLEASGTTSKEV